MIYILWSSFNILNKCDVFIFMFMVRIGFCCFKEVCGGMLSVVEGLWICFWFVWRIVVCCIVVFFGYGVGEG